MSAGVLQLGLAGVLQVVVLRISGLEAFKSGPACSKGTCGPRQAPTGTRGMARRPGGAPPDALQCAEVEACTLFAAAAPCLAWASAAGSTLPVDLLTATGTVKTLGQPLLPVLVPLASFLRDDSTGVTVPELLSPAAFPRVGELCNPRCPREPFCSGAASCCILRCSTVALW
mmetsp:Transcript_1219/g.3875  ORF Transcript_1219/g.3875 Transcript_1219/m.3875 type:complete len:172 (+) Transcript_1219:254-769(+)